MPKTIYTLNGFMGNMWAGPQADTGRHLSDQGLNLAYWQPIGYPSQDFPLSNGVAAGLSELQQQMSIHSSDGSPFLISSWSEGSIIATLAFYAMARGDAGWPSLSQFKGATSFGDPYREPGVWAPHQNGAPYGYPTSDPGGAGIGGPRNNKGVGTNPHTPDFWHCYAHPGDMYTVCDTGQAGDDQRIIFDFVLTQWTGAWQDIFEFAYSLLRDSVGGFEAVIQAISTAIKFFAGGTAPHVNYDPTPSMNFLAGIAAGLR